MLLFMVLLLESTGMMKNIIGQIVISCDKGVGIYYELWLRMFEEMLKGMLRIIWLRLRG